MSLLDLSREEKEAIWKGEYWGEDGVLIPIRNRFTGCDQSIESKKNMLSVEYSAANRAWSDLRKGSVRQRFKALWRLYDSARRAMPLARSLSSRLNINNHDEIDVVVTVLIQFRQRELAQKLLDSIPWYELLRRDYIAPHTKAFLIRHAINCGLAYLSNERIAQIEAYARHTEQRLDYRQAARVWRTARDLLIVLARREGKLAMYKHKKLPELERNARRCAQKIGAMDQIAKLR